MSEALPLTRSIDRSFALILGLVVAAIVFYGFSHTVDHALIHYKSPPPPILYVHVLLSSAWLFMFIAQSALVSARNVRMHRRLGLWGLALGTAVVVVGYVTVIVMRHRDIDTGGGDGAVAFLSIPLNSLLSFAVLFGLAALWRKQTDRHRRLMILATCALTLAALARIPAIGHGPLALGIADGLMIAAAVQDWARTRRPHPVYLIGIPALFAAQLLSTYLAGAAPPAWMAVARFLLRWT